MIEEVQNSELWHELRAFPELKNVSDKTLRKHVMVLVNIGSKIQPNIDSRTEIAAALQALIDLRAAATAANEALEKLPLTTRRTFKVALQSMPAAIRTPEVVYSIATYRKDLASVGSDAQLTENALRLATGARRGKSNDIKFSQRSKLAPFDVFTDEVMASWETLTGKKSTFPKGKARHKGGDRPLTGVAHYWFLIVKMAGQSFGAEEANSAIRRRRKIAELIAGQTDTGFVGTVIQSTRIKLDEVRRRRFSED